jgi:hypothetical protein
LKRIILATALAGSTLLTGCGDPCSGLTATDRDRQAAQDGYEVEREGRNGAECELQEDGTWDTDS